MFAEHRRRRRLARVRPGDGRQLGRLRWWQTWTSMRSRLHLSLSEDGQARHYVVDVPHWRQLTDEDGRGSVDLYRDGRRVATSQLPATFPVPGGVVEVVGTAFGLKRCHYVADDGGEWQLTPDRTSAEGRRARFATNHPTASRVVGAVSAVVLLASLVVVLVNVAAPISEIPPIADNLGSFTSPFDLPWWGTVLVGLVGALASTERALRLRHHWLLDAVG